MGQGLLSQAHQMEYQSLQMGIRSRFNLPPQGYLFLIMPIQKVNGGYRWGRSGKIYPTRAQAEAQARAIYASGYREKSAPAKKK